jgi:hypothetical protein
MGVLYPKEGEFVWPMVDLIFRPKKCSVAHLNPSKIVTGPGILVKPISLFTANIPFALSLLNLALCATAP